MKLNKVVYRHIRLDTNEVFYVGIGSKKRPYAKGSRSKWWKRIVNKSDYRVDILFTDLSWEAAEIKEIEFIKLYGRKDLKKGTLVNMTDGGEGKTNSVTSATKLKMKMNSGVNKVVSINGKYFTNVTEASEYMDISRSTLRIRLKSSLYPSYKYKNLKRILN